MQKGDACKPVGVTSVKDWGIVVGNEGDNIIFVGQNGPPASRPASMFHFLSDTQVRNAKMQGALNYIRGNWNLPLR